MKKVKTHLDIERKREINIRALLIICLTVMLVLTLVSYMYIRNGLDSLVARNLTMETNNAKLEQKIKYLQSEVNELSRPGLIRQKAEQELGLVNSTPQAEAIYVKKRK